MNNPDPIYSEDRLFVETVWRKGRGEIERLLPEVKERPNKTHKKLKRKKK